MATVIDDSDPNLRWGGAPWITVHDAPSALIDRYYNRTMHASTNDGDFVEIKWNGADIAVYGARRDNHVSVNNQFGVTSANAQGVYGVILDSGTPQYFSGNANPSTFQQVLYATSGLAQGDHTLRVSNELNRNAPDQAGWIWFDFDFVAFNGVIKNANPGGSDPAPPPPPAPAPAPSSSSKPAPSSSISTISRPPPSTAPTLASSISFTLLSSSSSAPLSISSSTISIVSSSSAVSSSSSSSMGNNTSQAVFSASAPITLPSGFSSVIPTLSVSGSSSNGVTRTDGQPSQPSAQGGDSAAEGSGQGTSSNKTTVVAVSSTVIALAVLVVATVAGIWWHRRRKRLREVEAMEEYHDGYVRPESSWTRI